MLGGARFLLNVRPVWYRSSASLFLLILPLSLAAETRREIGEIRPILEKYCFKCHGEKKQKGDIRLDTYLTGLDVLKDRKVWLSVLEQLEEREMPPEDPVPREDEYRKLIDWVDAAGNQINWDSIKHPGHVTLPRLTQVEYNHTIRDLLGLDLEPGRNFSPDGEGRSGFTNDRDNLFVTASEMEKYFTASEMVGEALESLQDKARQWHLEAEEMFITESKTAISTFQDGSRGYILSVGQKTLYQSLEIPVYGFYRITLRGGSTTRGPSAALIRFDNQPGGELPVAGHDFEETSLQVFLTPGNHQITVNSKVLPRVKKKASSRKKVYQKLPENAAELVREGSLAHAATIPVDDSIRPPLLGTIHEWNKTEYAVQRAYEWLRLHGPDGDPKELDRFVRYVKDRSRPFVELLPRLTRQWGIDREEFERRYQKWNANQLKERTEIMALAKAGRTPMANGMMMVDWLEMEGPIVPGVGSRPALFQPASDAVARGKNWDAWFRDFMDRAFREPVSEEGKQRYIGLYQKVRREGKGHSRAARRALSAVLMSPEFLYRAEELPAKADARGPVQLNDFQLASRLSYFLWQSCPDKELRDLAGKRKLTGDTARLIQQVERMLKDPKSRDFFSSFAGQWLGYDALGRSVIPDGTLFPEVTDDLLRAMKEETRLLFQRVFQENRSILSLLNTHETFLNGALAKHYGISGVKGESMRLVSLTDEQYQNRGGILGMGSILTATSTPLRTSPVLRGVWLMEKILDEEPGEPPADAGALPGNAGKRGKTLREELEIHRDRADCADCHNKIDPLGFGLEGYDAVGRIRNTDEQGRTIDSGGTLPDGSSFIGVGELREYLVEQRRDDFLRIVVNRLLSFALGRELQIYDEPATEQIVKAAKENDYRAYALVNAIVMSYPFRNQHVSPELTLKE